MKVYIVIICSFLVVFAVSQAADVTKPASKPVASVKLTAIDSSISREVVLSFLNGSNKIFLEGENGKPTPAIKYFSAAGMVKNWMNFRFLEADTGIDRSWYERVNKMLDYLATSRDFLELAKENGHANTDEYKKVLANFNEVSKRFPELLDKPMPVEKKKLEKLRDDKRKWELEKKREKAKGGGIKEDE